MLAFVRRGLGFALAAAVVLAVPAVALAAGRTHQVDIRDLAFKPATVQAEVGDTIAWVNADIFRHSATALDGSFNLDMVPGARGEAVLSRPGVIRFYCRYHPDMKGEIVVRAKKAR